MSFGKYQYQHRYYKHQPHKKIISAYPTDTTVLPLSNYVSMAPYYTPQISKPVAYQNPLNLRVRAGEIAYNQPGWEGLRLKSYVTDKYSQNYLSYQNDREIIQKFKREAEQQKRRRKIQFSYPSNPYRTIQKQPQQIRRIPQQVHNERKDFLPNINNPEREFYPQRYDVGIMARLKTQPNSPDRQINHQQYNRRETQSREEQRRQRQTKLQEQKRREYKKKYKKLKNKLKQELALHQKMQQQQQYLIKNKTQESQFDKIKHLISDVSLQMAKNTIIFNEGLRVEKQLKQLRPKTPQIKQQRNNSNKQMRAQQSRISTFSRNGQKEEHKSSPKVVYTKKPLNRSYMELQQLRSQMDYINEKMGKKQPK